MTTQVVIVALKRLKRTFRSNGNVLKGDEPGAKGG